MSKRTVVLDETDPRELEARIVLPEELRNKFSFGTPTQKNIATLRALNIACLPVRYRHYFYEQVLQRDSRLTRLVYFNDVLVGGVCTRIENNVDLYVMSITVLKPYRRMKIGSYLMNYIINFAKQNSYIKRIYLNVHTLNVAAIKFYENAFGFVNVKEEKGYYSNLNPPDCFVLEKIVREETGKGSKSAEMAEKGLDLAQADKDWEYLKQIADNPTSTGWKEEKNNKNDGVIVYSRVCDDQAKNIIEFRGDGEVDASVQLCSDIVNDADSRVKWETTMENYHILWRGENGYHACYNQSKSVIGGVISSRDFITLNVIRPTESGVVISAGSSTNAKLIDEKPGVVRGWCYPCGWIMTPINENKTKIIYIMRSDLKGILPVWAANQGFVGVLDQWFGKFKTEIKKRQSK